KVPVDPDEGLLDQILGPLTVARGAIDEVQQTRLIAVHQQRERTLLAGQERGDQTTIIVPGEEILPGLGSSAERAIQCGRSGHRCPLISSVSFGAFRSKAGAPIRAPGGLRKQNPYHRTETS